MTHLAAPPPPGHARVYVAFDVLYRYLRARGLDVHYVRNFTDVDDKIIARAAESGEEPAVLSERWGRAMWGCGSWEKA